MADIPTSAASAIAKALDIAAISAITEIQATASEAIENFIEEHTIIPAVDETATGMDTDGTVTTDANTLIPSDVTNPVRVVEVSAAEEGFAVRFEECRASGAQNGWDWATDTCRPQATLQARCQEESKGKWIAANFICLDPTISQTDFQWAQAELDKFYTMEENQFPVKYVYWRNNLEQAFLSRFNAEETTGNLSAAEDAQRLGEIAGMDQLGTMEEFEDLYVEWAPLFDAFQAAQVESDTVTANRFANIIASHLYVEGKPLSEFVDDVPRFLTRRFRPEANNLMSMFALHRVETMGFEGLSQYYSQVEIKLSESFLNVLNDQIALIAATRAEQALEFQKTFQDLLEEMINGTGESETVRNETITTDTVVPTTKPAAKKKVKKAKKKGAAGVDMGNVAWGVTFGIFAMVATVGALRYRAAKRLDDDDNFHR